MIGSLDYAMQLQKAKDLLAAASTTAEPLAPSDTDIVDVHAKPTDVRSYPIIQFEFERVQNPLVIGIWILSASIAKIGKFHSQLFFFFIKTHI